jgi:hypothetical protein
VGLTGIRWAGTYAMGDKRIIFLAETLSKLRFFLLHSPSTVSTSKKHMTGGSGVRGKTGSNWVKKFSIVFAPYSIDR